MKGSLAFGVIKAHSRDKCPAKDATCNFCKKQGHFERACLRRKARTGSKMHDKDDKRLHNVNASDPESSGYEDNYDLNPVIIDTVRSQNAHEVFAPVVFKPNTDSSATFAVQGKVDTGAMVSCMPVSMVFCQAFLEHSRAQTMLKCRDLRKSATTFTSWKRSRKHIKPN